MVPLKRHLLFCLHRLKQGSVCRLRLWKKRSDKRGQTSYLCTFSRASACCARVRRGRANYETATGKNAGSAEIGRAFMEIFRELGALVDRRWGQQNYSDAVFPEIAERALQEIGLATRGVTPWEIIRWVHAEPQLPRQPDIEAAFGNPPITLYCGSRFYIDIYFWLDGTTDIHQHSFAGAFQVLTGSSIHSRYSFREEQKVNEHFLLGRMMLNDVELLREGDIRQIIPGREHIHSLFHLDRPSCTITVRTFALTSKQPQYSYRKPYVAIDPFYKDSSLIRKLQTVSMLLNLEPPGHDELVGELISNSDFQTTFLILQDASRMLGVTPIEQFFELSTSQDRFGRWLELARKKHGRLIDYLLPVLAETQRQSDLLRRRQFITSNEHRFFLALLLNVPSARKILELVRARFPEDDPIERVLDWVMELSTTRVWGATEANVMGLDFADDHLFVLECLLKELSPQQIQIEAANNYPEDYARELVGRFDQIADSLRASVLLGAMLAEERRAG